MLSIIIPAYNASSTIERCLRSIDLGVTKGCEIVVVNDCSTDNTLNVLDSWKSSKHTLKVLSLQENSGPGLCRDLGLSKSEGDWILFLDADDEIVPCVLDESIEFLSKNKIDVGLFPYKIRQFCTTPDHMMGGGCLQDMWKIDRDIFYSMGESQIKPRDNPDILEITNYPWNKVCSHLFLKEIGIEFGPYRMNEDIYPHWQILSNAEQVKFFMRHLVRYSLSNQGHATNVMDRSRFQLIDVLVKTKKMLDEHPEGKYFKKSFFSFCYRVLCWAYDALPNDLQPEFRSYSRRLVFSLTKEDIGYLSAAGKDVANYFYWVIS